MASTKNRWRIKKYQKTVGCGLAVYKPLLNNDENSNLPGADESNVVNLLWSICEAEVA